MGHCLSQTAQALGISMTVGAGVGLRTEFNAPLRTQAGLGPAFWETSDHTQSGGA